MHIKEFENYDDTLNMSLYIIITIIESPFYL